MEFRRPTRRLDVDEEADLSARRGDFTGEELDHFNCYCARLMSLADLSGVVCSGVTASHPCPAGCGKTCPSGIPSGWSGSKWDLCPACVRARRMVALMVREEPGAIDRELLAYCTVPEAEDRKRFFAAMQRLA
jgi:hypothetical protein